MTENARILQTIIEERCSYRGTYAETPVPREHLRAIMQAGLAAPSGCNMQTTSLIAVDDPEKIAAIRATFTRPIAIVIWVLIVIFLAYSIWDNAKGKTMEKAGMKDKGLRP